MKHLGILSAAVCSAALLAGCAKTLRVEPIAGNKTRTGIGYVLPFTQYATTVTWTLDYCPKPDETDANASKDARIAVKVEAIAGSADDGTLAFMIDPQELQSITAVTSFTAKWHDGRNMLSTINASVDDRSAQIVGNVVKTAVKLFPLVAGLPPLPLAPGATAPPPPPIRCKPEARTALESAKTAKGLLKAQTALVETETATVTDLTRKVVSMGAAVDERTKKDLSDAIDRMALATAAQTEAAEAFAAALKPITYVRKLDWPENGNTFSGGPLALPLARIADWIEPLQNRGVEAKPVYLQIERTGTFGRNPGRLDLTPRAAPAVVDRGLRRPAIEPSEDAYALPAPSAPGLRYRMAAGGRLVACWRSPCGSADPGAVIARFDGPIVQLGYVNILPFRSRAFGNNSIAAEFAPDGSLKSVGYEQKTAPAESVSAALADAATQASSVLDPTVRLQSQTAYLKALKEQRDAIEGLKAKVEDSVAAETASLGADTTLINARLANIEAQIALEQLRQKTGR